MKNRKSYVKQRCLCGNNKFKEIEINNIKLDKCINCGIIQFISMEQMGEIKYRSFYENQYPPTKKTYVDKEWKEIKQNARLAPYDHDKVLAKKRCKAYGIKKDTRKIRILDVGSGSGAFVDECRERGFDAYGCEVSQYYHSPVNEYVYKGIMEKMNFPTDDYDFVTCHDVIEHSSNPIKLVSEMFRTTKQYGQCIIDFPNFFHKSGKHHWKIPEHVWYFTIDQLKKLLEDAGFVVKDIKYPIESKCVFYLEKPKQNRVKILFPPGMGDSLWTLMKLESFCEENNIETPVDAHIVCPHERRYEGHKRSVPFLKLFPFVNSTGIVYQFNNSPEHKRLWKSAYDSSSDTVYENVLGCDYFISYNGYTISERGLDNADEYICDWYPPIFTSLDQNKYMEKYKNKYGEYLLLYFPLYGMYKKWIEKFPADSLALSINEIVKHTGMTPIFVGAKWDRDDKDCASFRTKINNVIDLTGKTSTEQIFGLIRGAKGMLAFPSGLSIMATVLKQKVLIIWSDCWQERKKQFNRKFKNGWNKKKSFVTEFAKNSCPPDSLNKNYYFELAEELTPEKLIKTGIKLLIDKDVVIAYINAIENIANKEDETQKYISTKQKVKSKNAIPFAKDVIIIENLPKTPTVTIMCVLKSNSVFNIQHVINLKNMIKRNTTIPFKFICLSDIDIDRSICESIRLKHNYDSRWSKIELFRHGLTKTQRIIYLDLDTIILKNVDDIMRANHGFMALKPWNKNNQNMNICVSSMMSWNNGSSYSFIYDNFDSSKIAQYSAGDKEYITKILRAKNKKAVYFQDITHGIYSYKRNCRKSLPKDARIVCFLGRPKLNNPNLPQWVKGNWK
jgi:SAM-dependent methyltransferase